MKAAEVREKFLTFFESKTHKIEPSAPIVIKDDPSLMFVNAGMVPFKDLFLGNQSIINPRVVTSQKCLRVSGKHNDLEEVGKDTYHHTMFEMLGNWSFSDYFKEEAIGWAWELLTEVYKINKEDLYISIFGGDTKDNLNYDEEALEIWKEHVDENRIIRGEKKDNFWEMGSQGPCGPCSEIHVDLRSDAEKKKVPAQELINEDHPEVIEIWNLVFVEYNRKADGTLEKLPFKHIDTGMGFERLCCVLQQKKSNYDTDVFTPIIREIETITGTYYGKNEYADVAIRVIADHFRAIAFTIADGQLPSNNGAGYVIRRILRRAVRYGFTFLNQKEPFIYKLAGPIAKQMGQSYKELKANRQLITNVVKEEELSFLRTLEQGLGLLDTIIKETKGNVVSGKKAFELYDTYGFPVDLTDLILTENNLTLNEEEFKTSLNKQKKQSRLASEVDVEDWIIVKEGVLKTNEEYMGYDTLVLKTNLARYRKTISKDSKTQYQLVFENSPFYPEGGGQVGDKGYIEIEGGEVIYVTDTKKENNLVVHITDTLPKKLNLPLKLVVDEKQRFRTSCNHSATHLLHQALREILGDHVQQNGSSVHSRYLRFDFTHFSKLSRQELKGVEDFVNTRIENKLPLVEKRNSPIDEALENGAIALFGEKYGDRVRTIQYGNSIELCGGTHVKNTGDIWHFKIINESAVAAGVRRIEAITFDATKEYFSDNSNQYERIKVLLKNPKDSIAAVEQLQVENNELKKEIENFKKEKNKFTKELLKNEIQEFNGINFLAKEVDIDAKNVKNVSFELGQEYKNLFLVLGTKEKNKATLTCFISKSLAEEKTLDAGKIIRELSTLIDGGGGGQPFFATAGGKKPEGLQKALALSKNYVN